MSYLSQDLDPDSDSSSHRAESENLILVTWLNLGIFPYLVDLRPIKSPLCQMYILSLNTIWSEVILPVLPIGQLSALASFFRIAVISYIRA